MWTTVLDVLCKGAALLVTQISCAVWVLLALPLHVLYNWSRLDAPPAEQGARYYEGRVQHSRRRPVQNSFTYPVRMALVELDSPPRWFERQQQDHHMSAEEARRFAGTSGKVLLLTNPVSAGFVLNPISVYYCFDQEERLALGIAEVTNTPWGERVTFCFRPDGDSTAKAMHVSPFQDMDNTWHLKASAPGQRLALTVLVDHPRLGRYFDAHLVMAACPPARQARNELSGWTNLLRFGFMPQRVACWIYWQAVKLAAKGCPVYPKPPNSFRQALQAQADAKHPRSAAGQLYSWRDALQWPWYV